MRAYWGTKNIFKNGSLYETLITVFTETIVFSNSALLNVQVFGSVCAKKTNKTRRAPLV